MANHASALKRAKQNDKRRTRNRAFRTRVRTAIKSVRQALETKDAQAAQAALQQAVPVIDEAAGKGVLHKKNASRKISRLARQVHTLGA
ncbi:MAG: 30S ribosomal protein S20 [Desulfarculus sp.]|nr:MAG: 30S ribosomal protein S20 [Desulfarculus sp.]